MLPSQMSSLSIENDPKDQCICCCRGSASPPVSPHGGSSASGDSESGKAGTGSSGGLSGWGIFGIVLGVVVLGAAGQPIAPLCNISLPLMPQSIESTNKSRSVQKTVPGKSKATARNPDTMKSEKAQ